jgi:hypothetical protein
MTTHLFSFRPVSSLQRDRAESALSTVGMWLEPGADKQQVVCTHVVSPTTREHDLARKVLADAKIVRCHDFDPLNPPAITSMAGQPKPHPAMGQRYPHRGE